MSLSDILQDIVSNKGWIAGSYVRDVLIRKEPSYVVGDIDVLIPFSLHESLVKILVDKHQLDEVLVDYNLAEKITHTHLHFGLIIIDIFSSENYEYLSPPDFDVNTLCWTGTEYTIWYPVPEKDKEFYGYSFDVDSIIERVINKQAVAMVREWAEQIEQDEEFMGEFMEEFMEERYNKLVSKGWTILNYDDVERF